MASAHDHHLPTPFAPTSAPPPTPSSQHHLPSTFPTADTLSLLLHRLPPSLSLPTRDRPSPPATSPPLISLPSPHPNLLSAATQLGYFQLTHHSIPSHLPLSAESESLSLFNPQKLLNFPKNFPLGFDDDETGAVGSFCVDSAGMTELGLGSLNELALEMERVALEVVEALSCAVGFENLVRLDPNRVCSLMWISNGWTGGEPLAAGKLYPYVVALEYQIRAVKWSLLADSGRVEVSPQVDSVLVTLGDIAQVWSNGKLKKVRGRPVPCLGDHVNDNSDCISMTLLLTLPLDTTVSPLPLVVVSAIDGGSKEEEGLGANIDDDNEEREERVGLKYKSFSFEDYAWRVYHERLLVKDPLDRYLI
ncbi:hypothetical protein LguiA_034831 [Lonicera macranthoides]